MMYEYRCPNCGATDLSHERADYLDKRCYRCPTERLKRVWSVSLPRPLHPYYDRRLESTIMSNSDYAKKLSIAGEKYSERTGIPSNYQPISHEEAKRASTDEGMKETHDRQVKLGMREPTGKIVK